MNLVIALKKDKMMEHDDEEEDMDHEEDMRKEMRHMETMSMLKKMLEKLTNMDKNNATSHPGGT